MPFLIMLAVLGIWAFFALRERPVSDYLCLFFAGILLTAVAEPFGSLVFHRYVWRLGVLFAHYSQRWPIFKAAATALVLGSLESWLVHRGYIIYVD